jgi:hypothetical protein
MENKCCSKCKNDKPVTDFNKDSSRADGYTYLCKLCLKEKQNKYYQNNIDKKVNYYDKNKEKISEINKTKYYANLEFYSEKNKKYRKHRLATDPLFKLRYVIKGTIRDAFRSTSFTKKNTTLEILGCSIIEFEKYLESKFEPWMTWENRGLYNGELNYGWDIDHIIPTHIAKTEEELIGLNHYTNLQPLCSHINRNIKKGNY